MPGAPPLRRSPDKTKRRSNAESQPKNTRRPGKIYGACNRCPVVRHVACLQLGATNPTNPEIMHIKKVKIQLCVCHKWNPAFKSVCEAHFPLQVRFFDETAALPFSRKPHANHRSQIARDQVPKRKLFRRFQKVNH